MIARMSKLFAIIAHHVFYIIILLGPTNYFQKCIQGGPHKCLQLDISKTISSILMVEILNCMVLKDLQM